MKNCTNGISTSIKPFLQEMSWQPVKDYFEQHAPADAKKKCKNLAQKKAYLTKELGLTLQCEPCQTCSLSTCSKQLRLLRRFEIRHAGIGGTF